MSRKKVFLSFITFLLSISFVVCVHELGHFITCKIFGVGVTRFSIGFGPALFSKKIAGTEFQIALLPLGGYNSINVKELNQANFIARTIIIWAGIFLNFVLAWLVFFIAISIYCRDKLIASSTSAFSRAWLFIKHVSLETGIQLHNFFSRPKQLNFSGIQAKDILEMHRHSKIELLLFFTAIFSLQVGVFNALPLPFLDGGQFVNMTFFSTFSEYIPATFRFIALIFFYLFFVYLFLLLVRLFAKSQQIQV